MSEDLKYKLFDKSGCIPEATMFAYIDGKLPAHDQHLVEKHLLDCELCSDALEGLSLTTDPSRIRLINEEVSARVAEKGRVVPFYRSRTVVSVAAGIALLAVGVFLFNLFNTQLAENKLAEVQTTAPEPQKTIPQITNAEPQNEVKPEADKLAESKTVVRREDNMKTVDDQVKSKQDNTGFVEAPRATSAADEAPASFNYSINESANAPAVAKEEQVPAPVIDADVFLEDNKQETEKADKSISLAKKNINNKDQIVTTETQATTLDQTKGLTQGSTFNNTVSATSTAPVAAGSAVTYSWSTNDEVSSGFKMSESTTGESKSKVVISSLPEYVGGNKELLKFLQDNYHIPEGADVSGGIRLAVTFHVDGTGRTSKHKILKGMSPAIDAEALRVLRLMPAWKPARDENNNIVEYDYTLPMILETR